VCSSIWILSRRRGRSTSPGIEEDEVGGRTDSESSPPFEAEGLRGTRGEQREDFREWHFVLDVQDADREAQCGFEAGDAVGGAVEFLLFLVRGVGA
jgi:hypothetical protein